MIRRNTEFEKLTMTQEERKVEAIRGFAEELLLEVDKKIKEVGKKQYFESLE